MMSAVYSVCLFLIASIPLNACKPRAEDNNLSSDTPDAIYPNLKYEDECQFIRDQIRPGATIKVPPSSSADGVYDCKGPIVLDQNNVSLVGEGEKKVRIRLSARTVTPLIIIGSIRTGTRWDNTDRIVRNVQLENFDLDGNRFAQIDLQGLSFERDSKGRFLEVGEIVERQRAAECWGEDPYQAKPCDRDEFPASKIRNNGITIRGAQDILVKNVSAHDTLSGGMVTEKFCERLNVVNFESYGHFYDGFAGYDTTASVFQNLNLHHNRASGISIDIRFNSNTFIDSKFSYNNDNGVFSRESADNRFIRIQAVNNCNNGFFLAGLPGKTEHGGSVNFYLEDLDISASDRGIHIADASCTGTMLHVKNFSGKKNPFTSKNLTKIVGYGGKITGHPEVDVQIVTSDEAGRIQNLGVFSLVSANKDMSHLNGKPPVNIGEKRGKCSEANRKSPGVELLERLQRTQALKKQS